MVFLDALKGRADGRSARREHQRVVAFGVGFAGGVVLHGHSLFGAVHRKHLALHPHIHVETGVEGLGGLQLQRLPLGDGSADVIGQAAVGKRDVLALFKQNDFGVFIVAAQPGSGAGAAGHTAHNQNFHGTFPAFRKKWDGGGAARGGAMPP